MAASIWVTSLWCFSCSLKRWKAGTLSSCCSNPGPVFTSLLGGNKTWLIMCRMPLVARRSGTSTLTFCTQTFPLMLCICQCVVGLSVATCCPLNRANSSSEKAPWRKWALTSSGSIFGCSQKAWSSRLSLRMAASEGTRAVTLLSAGRVTLEFLNHWEKAEKWAFASSSWKMSP